MLQDFPAQPPSVSLAVVVPKLAVTGGDLLQVCDILSVPSVV